MILYCLYKLLSCWPRRLGRGCGAAGLLGMRVPSSPGARVSVVVFCEFVCCQVEVSATDRSLAQRSPTECLCVCVCVCH